MFMCANGKINKVSNAIINKDEPFDKGSLALDVLKMTRLANGEIEKV